MNCHQPVHTTAQSEGSETLEGVTCAVCHIRDDTLLSSSPLSERGRQQHPKSKVLSSFSKSDFCAGCHQFSGPTSAAPIAFKGDPIQDTWGEWTRVSEPKGTCQQCHMPEGKHSFYGGHHLPTLKAAIRVDVDDHQMTLATTAKVAHAVPTGDPFRRLVLEFCEASCDTPLKRYTFGVVHQYVAGEMRTVRDTRLHPNVQKHVAIPSNATTWRLRYYYADPRFEERLPRVEQYAQVASGTFAPQGQDHP